MLVKISENNFGKYYLGTLTFFKNRFIIITDKNERSFYMSENENIEQRTRVIFLMERYAHYIFHRFFDRPGRDRALRVLYESGTITQKVFAEKMNIRPASSSEMLAKMESEGLITREQCEEDKRTIKVTLTPDGTELAKEMICKQTEAAKQAMLSLSDEELNTLEELLNKIVADWDERFGDEPPCRPFREPPERKRQ